MPWTILVIGDEPRQVQALRGYLQRSDWRVITASDGSDAVEQVRREQPDLILLDLDLLGSAGLDVARRVWAVSVIPMIMMTAQATEANRLIGLELGADNYLLKSVSPQELVARVNQAVLWRARAPQVTSEVIRVADLLIDVDRQVVLRDATPIKVTRTELKLLAILAREPERIFTRRQLLEIMWGEGHDRGERMVDAHLRNLRVKLEANPRRPRYLITVIGVGYKFGEK